MLREYLLDNIPRWISEGKMYVHIRSADGYVLSAVPIVKRLTPDQIIQLMETEDPSFEEYFKCKVISEGGYIITIDWRFKKNEEIERRNHSKVD